MTYHLSRAAYWRQWQTLAHFPTNNLRQDEFPGNAEILLLVGLLIAHSAQLAFAVQFVAYLVTTLAVYGLGRQLELRPVYAAVGAGAFATMPEVVLQSVSAQNDLTVAACVSCAVYFFVDAAQHGRSTSAATAGLALGLALGTKPTAFLVMPGLCLGAVALLWQFRPIVLLCITRRRIVLIGAVVLACAALAAPWYIANLLDYGNPSGPAEIRQIQGVAHPSLSSVRVNLMRYAVAFMDPEGPAMLSPRIAVLACHVTETARVALIAATRTPAVEPEIEWPGSPYTALPVCGFSENISWFGLAGWLAVTTALVWTMMGLTIRRFGVAWLLASGSTSFLLCASLLLRWQPWQGRLLITVVALCSPLLGILAQQLAQYRPGRLVLQAFILYAAGTGFATAINNPAKPLSAWGTSYIAAETLTRPEMRPVLDQLNRTMPANAAVGVFVNGDDWDFPLFGKHLDHYIEPLVLSKGTGTVLHAEASRPIRYVLTHQPDSRIALLFHELAHSRCHLTWIVKVMIGGAPWKLYSCRPRLPL